MVQTGDPTGKGKGGQSIWGRPFADEIRSTLKFNNRGILAMANSGPDTNKSQFFVRYLPEVSFDPFNLYHHYLVRILFLDYLLEAATFGGEIHDIWKVSEIFVGIFFSSD